MQARDSLLGTVLAWPMKDSLYSVFKRLCVETSDECWSTDGSDHGMDILLKKDRADLLASDGSVILSFERQIGGLYVAKLKLKRPTNGFGRQG